MNNLVKPWHQATRLIGVIAIGLSGTVFGICAAAAEAPSFVPLKAADVPERASSLLDQQVEVSGNFYSPVLVNPKSDFSRGRISDPSVDPRAMRSNAIDVVFNLVDKDTINWMAKNRCLEICKNVFVRGRLVMRRGYRQPVLEMTQISFESVAGIEAGGSDEAKIIAAKDQYGVAKPVLPPGSVPTEAGWSGWVERIPPTAPGYDAAKGMWKSMVAHAEFQRVTEFDQMRAIIRGPKRPTNFETYYRGVRDTGLSNLFQTSRYQDLTTVWPRVALIVEESPKGFMAAEYNRVGDTSSSDRCWRLRAKVWTGPARSEGIAPFNWCLSEMRFNISYASVTTWGMTRKSNMKHALAGTGSNRTTGPNPPTEPLPKHSGYSRQFSYDTIMAGNVLLDMGFDVHLPDGRVWLVDESLNR